MRRRRLARFAALKVIFNLFELVSEALGVALHGIDQLPLFGHRIRQLFNGVFLKSRTLFKLFNPRIQTFFTHRRNLPLKQAMQSLANSETAIMRLC